LATARAVLHRDYSRFILRCNVLGDHDAMVVVVAGASVYCCGVHLCFIDEAATHYAQRDRFDRGLEARIRDRGLPTQPQNAALGFSAYSFPLRISGLVVLTPGWISPQISTRNSASCAEVKKNRSEKIAKEPGA
jgi:hypothetical protein